VLTLITSFRASVAENLNRIFALTLIKLWWNLFSVLRCISFPLFLSLLCITLFVYWLVTIDIGTKKKSRDFVGTHSTHVEVRKLCFTLGNSHSSIFSKCFCFFPVWYLEFKVPESSWRDWQSQPKIRFDTYRKHLCYQLNLFILLWTY